MSKLISDKYKAWQAECEERFLQLKKNEEELNRIFIDIYGLQDELTPDVADKDITVHRVYDTKDDVPDSMKGSNYVRTMRDEIVSLISYAVGCMFGRYSTDVEGLCFAGGEFSDQWLVISGQNESDQRSLTNDRNNRLVNRKVVEYYVGKELSRALGMAEINGLGDGDLQLAEAASERGAICTFGSDEEGGGFDSFQYRRGSTKKLYEGVRSISLDSERFKCRVTDTVYDLCSPEILNAISIESGNDLVNRGWQDADKIDWKSIHQSLTTNHYSPDEDNIIPITDDDYFSDDIVGRFVDFVRITYGEDTLEQNLQFIADALGGKGSARETIRKYFISDFYSDHIKTYQKRPIYWLFDSGKKNGFKALIYMHRYQPDLLARMRTDYVHEQQERYRTQLSILEENVQSAEPSERVKLNKQISKLRDQALEIQKFEEKIHHLADQMILIDLDDGVKVNYAKFQDVLQKIK